MFSWGNTLNWITKTQVWRFKKITEQKQFDNKSIYWAEQDDVLCQEVPVALVYNGISHTVMMCSPRDLTDFALGFSLAEGIIDKPSDVYGIDVVAVCNGIEVQIELATRCFVRLKEMRRSLAGRTGCGICGTEQLQQIHKILPILDRTFQFDLNQLDECLSQLQQAQQLGKETGATHAAGFFDVSGNLLAIREDVGRHVALDKLLGWYCKERPQGLIVVTSRASYEMVQKAVTCGIEMLVAISASTDLAVRMAKQSEMTLIGFARTGKATVYCDKERLFF